MPCVKATSVRGEVGDDGASWQHSFASSLEAVGEPRRVHARDARLRGGRGAVRRRPRV